MDFKRRGISTDEPEFSLKSTLPFGQVGNPQSMG
jgi:hypothetical protein